MSGGMTAAARECKRRVWLVCTENLDFDVMVMESAEERMGANASDPLNWARDRRALRSRRG